METTRRYDIVRRESEKAIFWLEGVPELSVAKSRVEELQSFWPGEYQVFDLASKSRCQSATAPNNRAVLWNAQNSRDYERGLATPSWDSSRCAARAPTSSAPCL